MTLEASRVAEMTAADKEWLMDLITRNMKELYEQSSWGWKVSRPMTKSADNLVIS